MTAFARIGLTPATQLLSPTPPLTRARRPSVRCKPALSVLNGQRLIVPITVRFARAPTDDQQRGSLLPVSSLFRRGQLCIAIEIRPCRLLLLPLLLLLMTVLASGSVVAAQSSYAAIGGGATPFSPSLDLNSLQAGSLLQSCMKHIYRTRQRQSRRNTPLLRSSVSSSSLSPSHYEKTNRIGKLYCRTGYHLLIHADGKVNGTHQDHNRFGRVVRKFEALSLCDHRLSFAGVAELEQRSGRDFIVPEWFSFCRLGDLV
ncbi:unnamed protein product [Soboliphyme baturini]|uniref:Fibroblast growth factor n=1 Tax=Soboliphyme baturini TaxID=241478 RepID=A0A183IE00_9BILA|nr:unnamed protein product [Soboliphyme baturini]